MTSFILSFLLGILISSSFFLLYHRKKRGSYQSLGSQIIKSAEEDANLILQNHKIHLKEIELEKERMWETQKQKELKKLSREFERIKRKDDILDMREQKIEKQKEDLDIQFATFEKQSIYLEKEKLELAETKRKYIESLEQVSSLSQQEAKTKLMHLQEQDIQSFSANILRKKLDHLQDEIDEKAQELLLNAIQRLAVSCTSESCIHTVSVPSDDYKARIIGREGRNIRALEQETGINIIIDETPKAIVLSGFDPLRIEVAKIAIKELILDGRIHPTRIYEVVEKAKKTIKGKIKSYGQEAAEKVQIYDLHPELIQLLGKLKFRSSLYQNLLNHSIEVSLLMGLMAEQLKLDVRLAKRIGLLHDIGKALNHEVQGDHAKIGHDIALRYGETEHVAKGILCHHGETGPTTVEASLLSPADSISASRPGARKDDLQKYIQRLEKLEQIALGFEGVSTAYALQAGKELQVIVKPDMNDDALLLLTKELTKRIENELQFKGKIKITAIREKRIVQFAI